MLELLMFAKTNLDAVRTGPGDKSLSMEWGIILLSVILGLLLTLMPPKRTSEIKKQTEE